MRKLLVIGVLALCLAVLFGIAAGGSTGPAAGIADPVRLWQYRMEPGDRVTGSSDVYGPWNLGHRDVHVVINDGPATGDWSMEIRDCCTAGNRVLAIKLGVGGLEWGTATYPDAVSLGTVSIPEHYWVLVVTGYVNAPGGFPSVYYYDIAM